MRSPTASTSWSSARGRGPRIRSTCRRRPAAQRRPSPPDRNRSRSPTTPPSRTRGTDPSMANRVRKAVFPVAGLGTRLLPATKNLPKEMVTIVDRPLIQYAVDEAREAGIEEMIFVTGRGKSALVDYFDVAFELETALREKGKSLDVLAPSRARFGEIVTVRQQQPLGLGHAVWCARDIVGDEAFAVLLPDDLMAGRPGALKQMVDAWEKVGGSLVATEEVPAEKTKSYGIITPGETNGDLTEVRGLVEKPSPEEAPSRLGVIGRYILQPQVMRVPDAGARGAGGGMQ